MEKKLRATVIPAATQEWAMLIIPLQEWRNFNNMVSDLGKTVREISHKETYLTINEVSELLNFSRPSIYRFISKRDLKACRIGKRLMLKKSDVEMFISTPAETKKSND